jgi:NADH:ubiquinone oxidoreductase subunit 6 (subunit J)
MREHEFTRKDVRGNEGARDVSQAIFLVIAVLGLATALGTILARNLVRAALSLIAFFFMIACQFVLLEAGFLAALQVLVYIGAVAILLMFGIMLTRNIQGDDPASSPAAWRLPGLAAGFLVFVVLAYGIGSHKGIGVQPSWVTTQIRPRLGRGSGPEASARSQAANDMARVVGEELMTRYLVAFEVAGLLLTAALVGAIAIAHRDEPDPVAGGPGRRRARDPAAAPPPDANGDAALRPVTASAPAAH